MRASDGENIIGLPCRAGSFAMLLTGLKGQGKVIRYTESR